MSHQSQHDLNLTEFFREFYHLSRKTKNLDDFLEKSKEQLGSVLETLGGSNHTWKKQKI